MEEVLHANIFFYIASVATVVFCVLVSLILYHVLKIVRSIRRMVDRVEAGSEAIAQDISELKAALTNGGFFMRILSTILGSQGARRRRSRKSED